MDSAAASIRAFVGIRVEAGPAILEALEDLGRLGPSLRPSRESQLHVTSKFLGDASPAQIPVIVAALTRIAAGRAAFDWTPSGIGVFPSAERPGVVWAGIKERDAFASLAEEIDSVCEDAGFPREGRPFHPHLTLARVKFRPPAALSKWLHERTQTEFEPQRAGEILLYRSEQTRDGYVYTPLHIASFAAEPR